MYSDDPVGPDDDDLDRDRLAAQLCRSIKAISEQTDSAVVALVGPWGSGKTSLLIAMERVLGVEGWYLAHHNPWTYTSYETAVVGFFSELRQALPDDVLGPERREAIGNWAARVAPFGSLGGLVGVDASAALGQVATLISGDRSPEKLRSIAADALRGLDAPVLVVLDDLDRLEPGELLLTFRLVRLLGRLPNVYYLLAYDEKTVAATLAHTDLLGSDPGRAQQYLEKMVQVRLDIPPLLPEQQIALMNRGVGALSAAYGIALTPDDTTRLQQAWTHCLSLYLDQPRALKRLFTQVDALWPELNGEVNFIDFVLMTFLRTFERRTYDLLIENRGELLGYGAISYASRGQETHAARWGRWLTWIQARDARNAEGVARLLSELFLPLRSARENMEYGSSYLEDIRARQGVGSEEFFDRYTQLGVPEGDLSDQLVSAAVAELRSAAGGVALTELEAHFDLDAAKALAKLERHDSVDPLPVGPTLELLARHYLRAGEQSRGFLTLAPDYGILRLALKICDRVASREVDEAIQRIIRDRSGLALAGDVVQMAGNTDEQQIDRPWLTAMQSIVADAIAAHLRSAADVGLVDQGDFVIRLLYTYRNLTAVDDARSLCWELLESPSWDLLDFLALMVPVGSASDGRSSWESLGDFPSGGVDSLLGIDRVLENLPVGSGIDADVDWDSHFQRRRAGVDQESRRRFALAAMDRLQRSRLPVEPDAPDEPG